MSYKKVIITKFGPPEVLKVIEEEHLPEPEKGEVRIKVLVTSAAFTDTLLRKGMYPEVRKKPPLSPGYDMVGIVDKCGEDAFVFEVGQKVAALTVYSFLYDGISNSSPLGKNSERSKYLSARRRRSGGHCIASTWKITRSKNVRNGKKIQTQFD